MNKTGLSRPGALQMLVSVFLMIVASSGPILIALTRPSHELFMYLTGYSAIALELFGFGIMVLYFVGFLRYCASKGYSMWIGFWLLFANVFGLIVLLMLPDFKKSGNEELLPSNKIQEMPHSA